MDIKREDVAENSLFQKWNRLLEILRGMESAAVAFSGGVDSTLLLLAAKEALGERMAAVTVVSGLFPEYERTAAETFCRERRIRQILLPVKELEIEGFAENPRNRCYLCKRELFRRILDTAAENRLKAVCEGSNLDDEGDYRPGFAAISELGIQSPLRAAGLYKREIRELSRIKGLPSADRPSFACLASRFVYGETITEEKLRMVEAGEEVLRAAGFTQFRVRIHGLLARIEVLPEELPAVMKPETLQQIRTEFQKIGFSYTALDLTGYRSGSMNEAFHASRGNQ